MNFTGALSSESNSIPVVRAAKSRDDFIHAIRRGVRNGDAEADAGAHRFLALPERAEDDFPVFRVDLFSGDEQIDQFDDRRPTFSGLHLREDLINRQ